MSEAKEIDPTTRFDMASFEKRLSELVAAAMSALEDAERVIRGGLDDDNSIQRVIGKLSYESTPYDDFFMKQRLLLLMSDALGASKTFSEDGMRPMKQPLKQATTGCSQMLERQIQAVAFEKVFPIARRCLAFFADKQVRKVWGVNQPPYMTVEVETDDKAKRGPVAGADPAETWFNYGAVAQPACSHVVSTVTSLVSSAWVRKRLAEAPDFLHSVISCMEIDLEIVSWIQRAVQMESGSPFNNDVFEKWHDIKLAVVLAYDYLGGHRAPHR
jgi:hypothetical protein